MRVTVFYASTSFIGDMCLCVHNSLIKSKSVVTERPCLVSPFLEYKGAANSHGDSFAQLRGHCPEVIISPKHREVGPNTYLPESELLL